MSDGDDEGGEGRRCQTKTKRGGEGDSLASSSSCELPVLFSPQQMNTTC